MYRCKKGPAGQYFDQAQTELENNIEPVLNMEYWGVPFTLR